MLSLKGFLRVQLCFFVLRMSNGYCIGLRIKRSVFRPCQGHCVVFLAKTLYSPLAGPDRSTQVFKWIQAELMLGWV